MKRKIAILILSCWAISVCSLQGVFASVQWHLAMSIIVTVAFLAVIVKLAKR